LTGLGDIHSILFVPGARPDRFEKALGSGAGLVCIDLEDAVAASDKDRARSATIGALSSLDRSRVAIRINGLATIQGLRDLVALADGKVLPAFIFVPMVAAPAHVDIVQGVLGDVPLVPLIETPAALRGAAEIAGAEGVAGMMFGGGDLSAQLGVELAWEPLMVARAQFVLAGAGRGIGLIDVPFVHFKDEDGLLGETRRAKVLGFTAKAAIHPAQVPVINEVFAPSAAELDEARAALSAYRSAAGQAVQHEGRMLEAPLVRRYEALLQEEERRDA
jgi:(S)-citramalyl-CoA lyase